MQTPGFFASFRLFLEDSLQFPGASFFITLILLLGITASAIVAYYVSLWILRGIAWAVEWTDTDWDDDLINRKFRHALSQLSPAIVVAWLLPRCFENYNVIASIIDFLTSLYIIATTCYAANTLVDNLFAAFAKREKFAPYAVKGIFEMVKLIFIGIAIIIAISLLIGKSPVAILTALGASAAILMLVFKDTILGLVASVQLTANKMAKKGDWVVVPKHNANGEVVDISLTTVKIRNWDNSITTVPPYSLISDSFMNFQNMRNEKARRVMRPIYIDMSTVRFLSMDELQHLSKEKWLDGININEAGRMVNLRLFRHYLEHWIGQNKVVRKDMIYMVREMEPTPSGLPLEIYFYTTTTNWKPYEHVQSDIFDHIYAVVPVFGLRIFQTPAGSDILALENNHNKTAR